MKKILVALFACQGLCAFAQENLTELAKPIVAEGKRLYSLERASWLGTDIFLEAHKDRSDLGGYLSYLDNDTVKCIFFSKAEQPRVLGTISFDSSYDASTTRADILDRNFTKTESDLYQLRQLARDIIYDDTLFKRYKNTSLNLIPLINSDERKVYVLTGTDQSDVVIFGNDYLLIFDKDNHVINKKQLHRNIIPINYGKKTEETGEVETTIHSHLPETGDYITATDICTLMLYEKLTKWKQHNVVSKNYLNIWNCETDELVVIPMSTIRKIDKAVKKEERKREKDK